MKAFFVPIKASGALGEYDISFSQHDFVVELSKAPWLGAYIDLVPRVNGHYSQEGYGCYYDPDESVPYFFVAAQGTICGYFFCLEMLPIELSHYYKLCQTLQVVSAKGLSSNPESLQELWDTIAFLDKPETSEDDKKEPFKSWHSCFQICVFNDNGRLRPRLGGSGSKARAGTNVREDHFI
ncbi:hypothetical protein H4I96_04967 [Botrytis cinerea]